ncbi:hypothetical protein LEP1GSC161_0652 [Leptospira santarosai str. CBC1416]|uniref:Uncharacterized protein n=2 Tax=Leptospira santarosai TaxID=28183 RepID=A0A0E2BBC6_9LEPT|nr:hypothetical protein [Leptospira santarosai]EMO57864.1 hypothetical protein LEP1GSC161_0652 [Leptospira santarosai str. CBC1416]EKO32199.1 hypothetical protein LEP1GSC179_3951 [Leptospira santarosai str. MOR084]EKR92185.1 hypothetical protein LEP1GSC163_2513 [Leptospira santarosai str. CBC379]MDI7223529.1 hypothetical protein [Leptospira santarosai]MDI7230437.1 hypothetical protein [Leptospira santarosai]
MPGKERQLSIYDRDLTLDQYKEVLKEAIKSHRIDPRHEDFREYDEGKNDLIDDLIEEIDRTPQQHNKLKKMLGGLEERLRLV